MGVSNQQDQKRQAVEEILKIKQSKTPQRDHKKRNQDVKAISSESNLNFNKSFSGYNSITGLKRLQSHDKTQPPSSLWDIVTQHKIQQIDQQQKEAHKLRHMQNQIVTGTLESQVNFQQRQRMREFSEKLQEHQEVCNGILSFKKDVQKRKQSLKNQKEQMAQYYEKQMKEKYDKDRVQLDEVKSAFETSLSLNQSNTQQQQRNQIFKDLTRQYQSENLRHYNLGLKQKINLKMTEIDQEKGLLNQSIKPFESNQQEFKKRFNSSMNRIDYITNSAQKSKIKIFSQAEEDRRNSIDQIVDINIVKVDIQKSKELELQRIKRKKALENMLNFNKMQIHQKNTSMIAENRNDIEFGVNLNTKDIQLHKREERDKVVKKRQQQSSYKEELINEGALDPSKRIGFENLEDREFGLNKVILKQYYDL